jgi:hypothetical protein
MRMRRNKIYSYRKKEQKKKIGAELFVAQLTTENETKASGIYRRGAAFENS